MAFYRCGMGATSGGGGGDITFALSEQFTAKGTTVQSSNTYSSGTFMCFLNQAYTATGVRGGVWKVEDGVVSSVALGINMPENFISINANNKIQINATGSVTYTLFIISCN